MAAVCYGGIRELGGDCAYQLVHTYSTAASLIPCGRFPVWNISLARSTEFGGAKPTVCGDAVGDRREGVPELRALPVPGQQHAFFAAATSRLASPGTEEAQRYHYSPGSAAKT